MDTKLWSFLIPPGPLTNSGNMAENWLKWKKNFMIFLKASDLINKPNNLKVYFLKRYIGTVGQKAIDVIVSNNIEENDNMEVILEKLDKYFINEVVKKNKNPRQSRKSLPSTENCIVDLKEKHECGIQKTQNIPKNNTKINNTSVENVKDHIEKANTVNIDQKVISTRGNRNCKRCKQRHPIKACPAHGFKCEKCGTYNHYTNCCPYEFNNNERKKENIDATVSINLEKTDQQLPTAPPVSALFDTLYPSLDYMRSTQQKMESATWSWIDRK